MFQIGDRVVYGVHGVCSIVQEEARLVDRKRVIYLVLEPIGQDGSRFYVPAHNPAAMAKLRKMLSREELEQMLRSEEVLADGWIPDENLRKQTYRELIVSGDRTRLMCMVRTIYRRRAEIIAAGKKCHLCDENFLRDAEKLLIGEISAVMDAEPEEVKRYLREHLQ